MIAKAITLLGAGALAALAASATIGSDSAVSTVAFSAPPPCEVVARATGGSVELEAVYNASGRAEGVYQFSVRSTGGPNSTNINQGGGFSVANPGAVSLGMITVAGSSTYDIALTVEANGQSYVCESRTDKKA